MPSKVFSLFPLDHKEDAIEVPYGRILALEAHGHGHFDEVNDYVIPTAQLEAAADYCDDFAGELLGEFDDEDLIDDAAQLWSGLAGTFRMAFHRGTRIVAAAI